MLKCCTHDAFVTHQRLDREILQTFFVYKEFLSPHSGISVQDDLIAWTVTTSSSQEVSEGIYSGSSRDGDGEDTESSDLEVDLHPATGCSKHFLFPSVIV